MPCGWDPRGANDKTVVSMCIDLKQFVCLEPTHRQHGVTPVGDAEQALDQRQ
jgi:hypothetical protein